jgi:hypothetical protein
VYKDECEKGRSTSCTALAATYYFGEAAPRDFKQAAWAAGVRSPRPNLREQSRFHFDLTKDLGQVSP